MSRRFSFIILMAIAIAVLLRLLLVPNPGFEADVAFWKAWGLAAADRGVLWSIANTNNNYPTPFAYVLGTMVKLYSIFADPHNFKEFWSNTNVLFLTVSKAFPILADFGIAAIIIYIGRNAVALDFPAFSSPIYYLLSTIYLLNPVSLIDGAWWGQVDSLGVFLFLLSLLVLLKRRPFWAGVLFMAAMMTKLQNMIYGPLFFLFIWQITGLPGLVRASAGALTGLFGLNIEFFLARDMGRVIASLTQNYDYFPLMSLNAFNPWWIVSGARGMQVSDKLTVFGITNAKTLGLITFASFYLFSILRQMFSGLRVAAARNTKTREEPRREANKRFESRKRGGVCVLEHRHAGYGLQGIVNFSCLTDAHKTHTDQSAMITNNHVGPAYSEIIKSFLEGLIIVNASFFLFQTQSHDRYLFPTVVFLLLWAPFILLRKGSTLASARVDPSRTRIFLLFYLLFTIFYFYNLHTALVFNYPNNGLPILSNFTQPFFTISAAVALLLLFTFFLFTIVKSSLSALYYFLFAVFIALFLLFTINYELFTHRPVSLTVFTPIISKQDYGTRVIDMPVDAYGNSKKWKWLSVQYAFYRKGIGTHADSFHEYDINRQFTKFTTDYGIDTEAGSKGTAVFEIYGDDKLIFRSDKIGRYDLPRHAEVDVSGIKRLGLVTMDAGDGNTDDHTDWLQPTLWP